MEYERAKAKFGAANNGPHESYAVILEEYQEALEAAEFFKKQLENYWITVRHNIKEEQGRTMMTMRDFAEQAAAEWIQVAAMCYKATITKEAPHAETH